jgi:AcrR family transcriptional regulator
MLHLVQVRADATRNRAKIFEAARDLVGEQGPGVSMEAVAGRAGVAVGTLYRHHPTKAALLRAVLADSADRLAAAAREALDDVAAGADPTARFTELVRGYARRYATDRSLKAAAAALGEPVATDPATYPEGGPEHRAAAAITDLLERAQRSGGVRSDVTLGDLLLLLGALPGGEAGQEQRERVLDVVVTGLLIRS